MATAVHIRPACHRDRPRLATASRTDADELSRKPGLTVRTISHDGGNRSRCRRNTSLIIRFVLLRRTLPRNFPCILTPRRLYSRPLAIKIRAKPLPLCRRPCRYTRSNSRGFLRRHVLGSPNRFTDSRRQPLTPLGPSASYHSLSGPGTHPQPETMGPLPLDVAGLKCSLAHDLLPFSVLGGPGKNNFVSSSKPFGNDNAGHHVDPGHPGQRIKPVRARTCVS